MTIAYHIYANDGIGGRFDYATPIANTTDLTCTTPPLNAPGDYIFAVRAYDPVLADGDPGVLVDPPRP